MDKKKETKPNSCERKVGLVRGEKKGAPEKGLGTLSSPGGFEGVEVGEGRKGHRGKRQLVSEKGKVG